MFQVSARTVFIVPELPGTLQLECRAVQEKVHIRMVLA